MRIGNRQVGPGCPPCVIAELGVNHDGDVERALDLVRQAHGAGCDAVKLQVFSTDLLMSKAARLAMYQESAGEADPVAMLRRLELTPEQLAPVADLARDLQMPVVATVFSTELVEPAEALNLADAYKTASPDIINRPLLDRLCRTGKPLIVSTGTATPDEIRRTLQWLGPARQRTALLQCVSAYPTPAGAAALGAIGDLIAMHDGPVGYSDHTTLVQTGGLAVACGAAILEKHLTYDTTAQGPDHGASLDSEGMALYAALARQAYDMLGDGVKAVQAIEVDVRNVSRQSLTTTRTLPAGHRLTAADLTVKRPGTGIEPWRLYEVLGRATRRVIEADMPVMDTDLAA